MLFKVMKQENGRQNSSLNSSPLAEAMAMYIIFLSILSFGCGSDITF